MGKVGGQRNFGYGKQMAWAGKNALADRYGQGHYATVAAHTERWRHFVAYVQEAGITDASQVDRAMVQDYGRQIAEEVRQGEMHVAYAQNLLSTVNVVLQTLRGDGSLRVLPAALVGQRDHVRGSAPAGMERDRVEKVAWALKDTGETRTAAVAALARDLGLRFREASLLNTGEALRQAQRLGQINITEGTKGGRGREVDRWVPVSREARQSLTVAAGIQGDARNLIPLEMTFRQWKDHAYHAWSTVAGDRGLCGFHDLRAAYACERYLQLTGYSAPAVAGMRQVDKDTDQAARWVIAQELGHGRVDVVAAYVGSTN